VHKTQERRYPTILGHPAHSRWDAFATECVGWMMTRVESGILARSASGEGRLLAIFDVFGDWANGRDQEAASVVDAVLKLNRRHPVGRIVALQAPRIRTAVVDLGRQAGLVDVEEFAESWSILLRGAALRAAEGDTAAPARARDMGSDLIARHRPRVTSQSSAYDGESEFGWVGSEARSGSTASPRSTDEAYTGSFDWFDVYGWDGELAAPVARLA
jgi:hypothetical protein